MYYLRRVKNSQKTKAVSRAASLEATSQKLEVQEFWKRAREYGAKPPTVIPKRRKLQAAPELYPDLDFERINECAKGLRALESDAQAIALVLERKVVRQKQ